MTKKLLNEAELLLLGRWEEAHQLEESMGRVREKYAAILAQAVDAVRQSHPELDSNKVYATQFWSKGTITFGRKSWPEGDDPYRMPGFWMSNLRMEVLAAEDEPPPATSIWISPRLMKRMPLDGHGLKEMLMGASKDVLSEDECELVRADGPGGGLLYFVTPTKSEILGMFSEGEGGSLIEAIVAQFDMLSKFVPVLDKVFSSLLKTK